MKLVLGTTLMFLLVGAPSYARQEPDKDKPQEEHKKQEEPKKGEQPNKGRQDQEKPADKSKQEPDKQQQQQDRSRPAQQNDRSQQQQQQEDRNRNQGAKPAQQQDRPQDQQRAQQTGQHNDSVMPIPEAVAGAFQTSSFAPVSAVNTVSAYIAVMIAALITAAIISNTPNRGRPTGITTTMMSISTTSTVTIT